MTQQPKDTPAPWTISIEKTADGDFMLCVCEGTKVIWQAYESPENWIIARKIAAAPKLLEALVYIRDVCKLCDNAPQGVFDKAIELSDTAIAKARGQS